MHITELRITNLQGIEQRNILFDGPTGHLTGPNGCGKSTVLKAIRLLLIGDKRIRMSKKSKTPATTILDHAGQPLVAEDFVGKWGDRATIEATIIHDDKEVKVTLIIKKGKFTFMTDPMLPGDDQRQAMYRYFGLEQHRLAVDPMYLLTSDDLLDGLMGDGTIPEERLVALFGEQEYAIIKEVGFKLGTLAEIKQTATQAYDMRTGFNREIKTLALGPCPDNPKNSKGNTVTVEMLPAVQKALDGLRADQQELLKRIGRAQGAVSKADQIAELKKSIKDTVIPKVPREPKITVTVEQMNAAHDELMRINAEQATLRKQSSVFQSGTCPTCGHKVGKDFEATMQAEIESVRERFAEAEAKYSSMNRDHAAETDAHRAWEKRVNDIMKLTESVAMQKETLARLEAAPEPENVDGLQAEYDTLTKRIADGELLRGKLAAIQQWQVDRNKHAGLVDKVEWYTQFYNTLNDPALPSKLAGTEIDDFVAGVNEVLSPFGKRINVDDGHILFHDDEHGWRDVREVSDGELVLCAWAVGQVYAGRGIAVLDRLEALDATVMDELVVHLRESHGGRYYAQASDTPLEMPGEVWMGEPVDGDSV